MINDLFMPIRRVSAHVRGLMWIAAACGLAYYLSVLQQSMPLPVLYRGCMVELAERVILPANLMLFCMGCARFGAFERVRRDPRDEFHLNNGDTITVKASCFQGEDWLLEQYDYIPTAAIRLKLH